MSIVDVQEPRCGFSDSPLNCLIPADMVAHRLVVVMQKLVGLQVSRKKREESRAKTGSGGR